MSYILDALRKSEQERRRGSVPDPLTIQEDLVRQRGRGFRWWYAAAPMIVILAASGLWFLQSSGKGHPVAYPAAGGSETGAIVSSTNSTALPEARKAQDIDPQRETREKTENGHSSVRSVSDRPAAAAKLPSVKEAIRENPADKPVHQVQAPAPQASEKPAPLNAAPVLPPPDPGRIYNLRELPATLQKELPQMSLTAFMYSATPSSRMVRINDRMMREWQELGNGVRLIEITPDGVVMMSRGYRFFVAMK